MYTITRKQNREINFILLEKFEPSEYLLVKQSLNDGLMSFWNLHNYMILESLHLK